MMNETPDQNPNVRNPLRVSAVLLWLLVPLALYPVLRSSCVPSDSTSEAVTVVRPSGEEPKHAEPIPSRPQPTTRRLVGAETAGWDPNGIEDFELIERSGRTVTKADLLGHPWVICFVFTRCAGPCPRVTGQMRLLQDWLAETDVRLVTLSVDPKYDTPGRLRDYADAFGADPERWLFLTGEQAKIYSLIINSFQMPVQEMRGEDRKPGWEVWHTTNILHVDAKGRVVGKYNALNDSEMVALRRVLEGKRPTRNPRSAIRDPQSETGDQ